MSKISLIGAGQIGGTLAHLIGIKELVDNNKNGYLIDSNNSEVLAEKLNYLMMNKKVCSDLGRNSRLRYEKYFMQENMVNEYERTVGIFQ